MSGYRHELKYEITYADYIALRSRLKHIMKVDPHTVDGRYKIRSIYFDNANDKALKEKLYGVAKREKFRIRWYNDSFDTIHLEKKMKINYLCMKKSTDLSKSETDKILLNEHFNTKDELICELFAKMDYEGLRPRVIVSYIREPYIFSAGNVRVTFDSNIRTTLFSRNFESITDIGVADTPGNMILEIKYDAFLPEVIRDIIQLNNCEHIAYSKYGSCRRYG